MSFTLILFIMLNSNYWLDFILIFNVYDSKFHRIYAVSSIYIIWVVTIFPVTFLIQVCFSPRIMALLHHHRWQLSFPLFSLVSSLPSSVTTRLDRFFHWKLFPDPSYFHHISSGGPPAPHHFQCVGGYVGQRVGMLCRLCCVVGTFRGLMRRPWPMPMRQPAGGGGGSRRQGGRPKREGRHWRRSLDLNSLIRQRHHGRGGGRPKGEPAHGRCRSSRGNNRRRRRCRSAKGKIISQRGQGVLLFSSAPLSPETEPVPPLMAEEEENSKENPPTPPDLGGANNAAPKEKLPQ